MRGDSQDKRVLEQDQDNIDGQESSGRATCADGSSAGGGRRRRRPVEARKPRDRISFADAAAIEQRVLARAAELGLRGSRAGVLAAVLALTCGYKRLDDAAVALRHITARIPGVRTWNAKTVGRALAWLAQQELIVYRPAQGRGATAYVAVHPALVGEVEVLARDAAGRVIAPAKSAQTVTFSAGAYKESRSKEKTTPLPPTRSAEPVAGSRPAGVEISTAETLAVLQNLPEPLAALPGEERWQLGSEIRGRLRAGWRPEQILEILWAPMPATVVAPLRLAQWRLRQNMPGPGPRLRAVQQAWDRADAQRVHTEAETATARWYGQVVAVTSPQERTALLRADEVKFGRPSPSPVAALAAAGRRIGRLYPGVELGAGLRRWAREILDRAPVNHPALETVSAHGPGQGGGQGCSGHPDGLLVELAIGQRCAVCDTGAGIPRPQLPLVSMVCEGCWPAIAAELADGDEMEMSA